MRRLTASAALLVPLLLLAGCRQELVCPEGRTACGGRCVSLLSDAANCGACGAAVGPLEVCAAGAPLCAPGMEICGDRCTDLVRDAASCGACGNACPGAQLCATGACVDSCAAGESACGRACVDTAADTFHCGGCGIACAAGERCRDGQCRADLAVACFATNEVAPVTSALAPAGDPIATPAGPTSLAHLGGALYAANADGSATAWLSVLPLDAALTARHVPIAGWDLQQARAHENVLLVTNAAVGSLLVLDPAGDVLDEIPMPRQQSGPNPHGVAVAGTTAYVALNGKGATSGQAIAKVDLSGLPGCASGAATACGAVAGEIDLLAVAGASDAPGLPFPSAVASHGGRVFVGLANLMEDQTPWGAFYVKPAGDGKLAVIDPAAGDAVSIVGLPGCGNPGALALAGTTLWVTCGSFSYPDLAPSALLPVNVGVHPPVAGTALAVPSVVPGKVAFCGGMGYVTDQASGAVVRFAPAARTVEDPVTVCATSPGPFGYAWAADVACPE